jgi:hypothetical protein
MIEFGDGRWGITDGDHERPFDMAVALRSTMTITTMNNKNAASVEAGGVGRGVGAQNGGSSVSGIGSDSIMLCSESSS